MINVSDLEPNKITKVPVELLRFDPNNPRYLPDEDLDGAKEKEIIEQLAKIADLGEIVQSISSNGYIDIEPLVALKQDGYLTVLEGLSTKHSGRRQA